MFLNAFEKCFTSVLGLRSSHPPRRKIFLVSPVACSRRIEKGFVTFLSGLRPTGAAPTNFGFNPLVQCLSQIGYGCSICWRAHVTAARLLRTKTRTTVDADAHNGIRETELGERDLCVAVVRKDWFDIVPDMSARRKLIAHAIETKPSHRNENTKQTESMRLEGNRAKTT